MAIDERFEARLSGVLHAFLDPAVGPHPRWEGSPASEMVRTGPSVVRATRRPDRGLLLVAALLAVVLIVGGIVAVGGLLRRPTPPPSPSPSQPAVVAPPSTISAPTASPSTAPTATPTACITEWSFHGTASPKGLVDGVRIDEFSGDGTLAMVFGHPIDTVRSMSITPTQPPFVNSAGRTVTVRGKAFYRLTIVGLNRPTQVNDNIGRRFSPPYRNAVGPPLTNLRRVQTPRVSSPSGGPMPDSVEVWIIGLERQECLDVTTRAGVGYSGEPGDDAIIVNWHLPPGDVVPSS
jgi:hypothetical protein